jgi:hypothetical protein
MKRIVVPSPALIVAVWSGFVVIGCGGNGGAAAVCGNGVVESGEQCDKGSDNGQPCSTCNSRCQSISVPLPQLQVHWSMLDDPAIGFPGTKCNAIGAVSAHVIINGKNPAGPDVRIEESIPCELQSKLYASNPGTGNGVGDCATHLPAGKYSVTVTLERDDNTAVTQALSTVPTDVVAGPPTDFNIYFGVSDFLLQTYTGSLQLRLGWGKDRVGCAMAMPPVVREALRLVPKHGQLIPKAIKTDPPGGTALDGTPSACYTPDGTTHSSENATSLLFGPYQLFVGGYEDKQAQPTYCGRFDVFVGPGDNNPIFYPVVPMVTPDGGVPDGDSNCP